MIILVFLIIFASIVSFVVHKIFLQLNNSLTSSFESLELVMVKKNMVDMKVIIWLTIWLTIVEPTNAYVWVQLHKPRNVHFICA